MFFEDVIGSIFKSVSGQHVVTGNWVVDVLFGEWVVSVVGCGGREFYDIWVLWGSLHGFSKTINRFFYRSSSRSGYRGRFQIKKKRKEGGEGVMLSESFVSLKRCELIRFRSFVCRSGFETEEKKSLSNALDVIT